MKKYRKTAAWFGYAQIDDKKNLFQRQGRYGHRDIDSDIFVPLGMTETEEYAYQNRNRKIVLICTAAIIFTPSWISTTWSCPRTPTASTSPRRKSPTS